MLSTFKYTIVTLFRTPSIMIWALAFPIILSSCFVMMFEGLQSDATLDPIPVIVVDDQQYRDSEAFRTYVETLSDEEGLLDIRFEPTLADAKDALAASEKAEAGAQAIVATDAEDGESASSEYEGFFVQAVISLDGEGLPGVIISSVADPTDLSLLKRQLIVEMMDLYRSRASMVEGIIETDPMKMADPAFVSSLFSIPDITEKVQLTANAPLESVRYYYALLGMAALMGGQGALAAVLALLPNAEALGARRSVSGLSRARSLAGTMLGSWAVSFVCLIIAYVYMRVVCDVDFGGRDAMSLLTIAVSALAATALGAAIAVIPKVPNPAKGGILTGITCFAALFAGLYGQPTMRLADSVSAAFPAAELVNPAVQISQAFYSLMYYDSYLPCLMHLGVLLIMVVVLFALSASSLRRVRYASL